MKSNQPDNITLPEVDTSEAWFKRGVSHLKKGDYAEAEKYFRQTRILAPESQETILNLGYVLQLQGRSDEALNCFEEVLVINPGHAKARYNRAVLLLRKGNLAEGFSDYEARFAAIREADPRNYPQPRWDGSPLEGKTLLLYCEQGLGDAIQFSRYIPDIARLGGHVVLEVQQPLVTLMSSLSGVEKVVVKSGMPPITDCQIPLMSLPHIFGTTLDTIPAPIPYLVPDTSKETAWRRILANDTMYRVGLVWRGSATNPMDLDRSCTLAEFAPLLAISGVSYYSLQLGQGVDEITSLPQAAGLLDLTEHLKDFSDTAALVANLDLVITVDTAVAHLAGAMGKPVWVLLAHTPDWRWMLDRNDSPWYPTMRLFRQPQPGDWAYVIDEVARGLQEQLSLHESATTIPKETEELQFQAALRSLDAGAHATAIEQLEALTARLFDEPAVWFNLGRAYDMSEQLAKAADCYLAALRLRPDSPAILFSLGRDYQKQKSFEDAEVCLRKAHELMPESTEILLELGAALVQMDKTKDAFDCCHKVLTINPNSVEAKFNLAYLQLRNGDYLAGFANFEARLAIEKMKIDSRSYPQPRWDGSPLDGSSILLFGEQGMGDVIQFARYIPLVAERGGKITLEVDPPLIPLFQSFPGISRLLPKSLKPPLTDVYIHLLSLPHIFGTTLETVPKNIPYLVPDAGKVAEWEQLLADTAGYRVGLVWRGSPNNPIDKERSCPLSLFAPLAAIPGLRFFSLQVGAGTNEIPASAIEILDHTARLKDMSDTAALIANLDLVIGVDTAVIHLAGALGKPVWVMLAHVTDWRWIIGRDDSPWYPTMRIFWQDSDRNWEVVISHVRDALDLHLSTHSSETDFSNIESCYHLGVKFKEEGDLSGAEHCFKWIVSRAPDLPDPQHSLGVVLHLQKRLQEAIEHYRQAIAEDPHFAQAHYNLANALLQSGRYAEAIDSVRAAIACDNGYSDAHWLLGMLLLQRGDFKNGWQEYEWRWQAMAFHARLPELERPQWDGSPLEGKTLLIRMEQGRGDMIQFVRYAPMIAAMGAKVIVSATPELLSLLSTAKGVSGVVSQDGTVPEFDMHIPVLSLPFIMGTTLDTIPDETPYLRPDPDKVAAWEKILPNDGNYRVGIAWQGSPAHRDDQNRSCALNEFLGLADLPSVTFFSLQLGHGVEQLKQLQPSMKIVDFTDHIHDFSDTAALMANLDLIITVDTATAHLAGALGRNVWTLLPFVPEWRWMLDREDSPWYPGMCLFRQSSPGDWRKVFERLRDELTLQTQNNDSLNQHGIALLQSGNAKEAERIFAAAIALNPADEDAYSNRGVALDTLNRYEEAIDSYNKALSIKPDFIQARFNMGNAYLSLFRLDEAYGCFEQVIELNHDFVPAYLALGEIAKTRKDYPEARKCFDAAANLSPSCAEALQGIAEICQAEEHFEEAIQAYQRTLELDPGRVNALNMLGTSYQCLERLEEAESCYRKALNLAPDRSTVINNLGAVLTAQEKPEEAITVFRHLIEIDPGYADAHWNLSMALLATGEYRQGWQEYEWRFKKALPVKERGFHQPRWDGSPLQGKTILLHCEQGFGDTLQFARYAPLVAKRGGRVIVECQITALKRLLSSLEGVAEVVVAGTPLPEFDCYIPMLSLPLVFDTTLETIPDNVPYLAPESTLVREWQQRITQSTAFKVGLVWFGRQSLILNRKRSCPLEAFKILGSVSGVEFYSLQIDEGVDQLAEITDFSVADLTSHVNDFADTAAFIANLDLVITIDTAVAHLAGAIGANTWVLLPYGADWRWLEHRSDTPWYPTMQLFRQPSPGDWPSVMQSVYETLKKYVNGCKTASESAPSGMLSIEERGHQEDDVSIKSPNPRLRVGLAWSGRQDNPLNRKRTCPLSRLQSIFDVTDVDFFSLQLNPDLDQSNILPLIDLTDQICDFEDTASLIMNLDLVITIDTSVAHLAGALGKETWVLLPHAADWRWLQNRTDSPWYPTLKLFRQPDHGDWSRVIAEIKYRLSKLCGSNIISPSYSACRDNFEVTDEHCRLEQSLAMHRRELAGNPHSPDANLDVGAAIALLGKYEEAEPYFRKVLHIEPEHVAGHLNLAYSLLSRGKYLEGWRHFEWRLNRIKPGQLPPWPLLKRETIGQHKQGTSVLVHCEQGFGDTIQFARFLPMLAASGYDVTVSCQPPLAALVSSVTGVKMVVRHGEALPDCNLQTMLLSLPHLLGIELENIPTATPYLTPCSDKILEWKQRACVHFGQTNIALQKNYYQE